MKIVTMAGALKSAMRIAGFVIEPRNTLPILGCVKFDGAKITATNLDMEVEAKFPAAQANGAACVDFLSLNRLVGAIPADETVTIETNDDGVSLAFDEGLYQLHTLPASDFPDIGMPKRMRHEKAGEQIVNAFRLVSHFVSDEETRYYLNGICLDGDLAVATNGHVLGNFPTGMSFDDRPIVPRFAVQAINRIGPFKSLAVEKEQMRAEFHFDGVKLRTKLIDGTFPEWQRVVPELNDDAPRLIVKRSELLAAIKRMSSVRLGRTHLVTFAAHINKCVAYSGNVDRGIARERLPSALVENAPEPVTISFDAKYLVLMCGAHSRSGTLVFGFNDAGSPCLIASEMEGFSSILMPVRSGNDSSAIMSIDMLARRSVEQGRAA
ncbi:DNA polymerase III subunit beta [Oricola sp.]|uniref:DNA polymerase III subunit beta n=1 Tax=Oricola sp. TaxID=1979950 RepID=UPI0025FD1483|nr:DNA polymerase III subunit beta [Oricola sp.]MCI5075631.1 DNA polymerase III subunit beta [Oricola sp.]